MRQRRRSSLISNHYKKFTQLNLGVSPFSNIIYVSLNFFLMLTHNTIFVDVAQWTAVDASATQNGLPHYTTLEESVSPSSGTTYKTQYAYFNASMNVSVVWTFKIQATNDKGSTWYDVTAATANTANVWLNLQVPVTASGYRSVFINGAGAGTINSMNSGFSYA